MNNHSTPFAASASFGSIAPDIAAMVAPIAETAVPITQTAAPTSREEEETLLSMRANLRQRSRETNRRCTEAAKAAGRSLLFGMTTALELRGVPLPERCGLDMTKLHTVSSDRNRRIYRSAHGLHPHVWKHFDKDDHTKMNQFVSVLSLFHVWAQMATHLSLEALVALGDAIVTAEARRLKRDPSAVLRDLATFIDTMPPFHGRPACVHALRFVMPRVDSPMESKVRLSLETHGIPRGVAGHELHGLAFVSGKTMTVDLAWPESKVALEYDGDQHRTDQAQWRWDKEKRDRMRSHDWIIITATAANLATEQTRAELALSVARALASRGVDFAFHVTARPLGDC